MRILAPIVLAAILALPLAVRPAHATQEYYLPTLFDVADVALDDVLNIRLQPDANSPVIGTLPPDMKGVEVVEETRGWGRVNSGEGSGWVSMRYLTYRVDVWEPGELPEHFRCLGTEPFWGFSVDGGEVVHTEPDQTSPEPLKAILDSGIFRHPLRTVISDTMTLVAVPQLCSDGMSDRMYGMQATLIHHGDQPSMQTGCCLIQE